MLTKFTIIDNFKNKEEEKKTKYLKKMIKIIRIDIKNKKLTEERGGITS